MLRSITEDNSRDLTALANDMGIQQFQVVGIVANNDGSVTLYYYE